MDRKKVGIITFHRAINYGAVWQTYALSTYLTNLGFDVKVIDYYPSFLKKVHTRLPKKPHNFIVKLFIIPLFNSFVKRYLPLTRTYQKQQDLLTKPPIFDYYICGSDQIWNTDIAGDEIYPFLLNFVPDNKTRIAYAASIGGKTITKTYESLFKEAFSTFDFISVRELIAQKEVFKFTNVEPCKVLDPTYLLEKEDYRKVMLKTSKRFNYILIIDLDNSAFLKKCSLKLKEDLGLPIVNISGAVLDYAKNPIGISPTDWISMIDNASYVITNSFHGLAFSIIFEKAFFCISKPQQEKNNRVIEMLTSLDLMDRFIQAEADLIVEKEIDYIRVNQELKALQQNSMIFLLNSLKWC